jgi:small subunit ribosomal protein S16
MLNEGKKDLMVRIRMARHGTRKKPFYRIVVAHGEFPRNGRFIEIVGTYDPRLEKSPIQLKQDRIRHWLGKGAQPSQTVAQLLKKHMPASRTGTGEPAA